MANLERVTQEAHAHARRIVRAGDSVLRRTLVAVRPSSTTYFIKKDMGAAAAGVLTYLEQTGVLLPYEQTNIALAASPSVVGEQKKERLQRSLDRLNRRTGSNLTLDALPGFIQPNTPQAQRLNRIEAMNRRKQILLNNAVALEAQILVRSLGITHAQAIDWLEKMHESGEQLGLLLSRPETPSVDLIDAILEGIVNQRPQLNEKQKGALDVIASRERAHYRRSGSLR